MKAKSHPEPTTADFDGFEINVVLASGHDINTYGLEGRKRLVCYGLPNEGWIEYRVQVKPEDERIYFTCHQFEFDRFRNALEAYNDL